MVQFGERRFVFDHKCVHAEKIHFRVRQYSWSPAPHSDDRCLGYTGAWDTVIAEMAEFHSFGNCRLRNLLAGFRNTIRSRMKLD